MADFLTREEVLAQLSSITKQIDSGIGVIEGASKTAAKEDAYAKFIKDNQSRLRLSDVGDFLTMTPTEIAAQYVTDYTNQGAADFDAIDFVGVIGAPPKVEGVGDFKDIGDAFDSIMDRYEQPVDPMVASSFNLADYQPGGAQDFQAPNAAQDFRNLNPSSYGTVDDLIAQGKIASGLFDPMSFQQRNITRGTPVVSRGLDSLGLPTTAITMGQSTAQGSGPDIGELTTYAQFPSTGMGINADGTGTTTVGTQDTTGNIVATGADNLTMFDTPTVSQVDPNVMNIGTGVGGTNTAGTVNTSVMPIGLPKFQPGDPDPAADTGQTPLSVEQQVANIIRESESMLGANFTPMQKQQALDAGKAKIAALGVATPGGISAGQIAAGGQMSGATRLLDLDTEATVDAVRGNIQREYQPEFSADTPYMEEEETVYTFNQGGPVSEPTSPYKEFTMSVSVGPNDIAMQKRQQGVQNMMNSRAGIMPSNKMLSALDRIMGRNQNG